MKKLFLLIALFLTTGIVQVAQADMLLLGVGSLPAAGPSVQCGTQLAIDSFDTAGSLSAYTNWGPVFDTEDSQVVGGVVQPNSTTGYSGNRYDGITWPDDQCGQFKVLTLNTASNRDVYVLVRAQTGSLQYYACGLYGPFGASVTWEISKQTTGGGFQVLATGTTTVASGDILGCKIVSDDLTLMINGNTIGTALNDTSFATGSVGIILHSGAGATSDAQIDDFFGGAP